MQDINSFRIVVFFTSTAQKKKQNEEKVTTSEKRKNQEKRLFLPSLNQTLILRQRQPRRQRKYKVEKREKKSLSKK